jgi:hypothetical protein
MVICLLASHAVEDVNLGRVLLFPLLSRGPEGGRRQGREGR